MQYKDYLYGVCVRCMTYNHAKYIINTLNSFCSQRTAFKYVCEIVDDNSTDGESEMLNQYLRDNFSDSSAVIRKNETSDYYLSFSQHKDNPNCFFAVYQLKYNHNQIKKSKLSYLKEWEENAKYIALCEGDDYWIDPLKLQMQYDYMEKHRRCSLVTHLTYSKEGEKLTPFTSYYFDLDTDISIEQIINNHLLFHTSSMFFRSKDFKKHLRFILEVGGIDYLLKLLFASEGNVHLIPQYMSVYRRMTPGSWSERTLADINKYKSHLKYNIYTLKQFDEYTNKKYSESLSQLIIRKEFELLLLDHDIRRIKTEPYKDVYNRMSFRRKVSLLIHYLLKWR